MRKALFVSVLIGALAYAAPATAGCWATVELSPRPTKITSGTAWTAQLTVLQHGMYPLPDAADARPTVTIESSAGDRKTFAATPVESSKGRYAANVVFPSAGPWTYTVFDDFTSQNGRAVPCSRTHEVAADAIDGRPLPNPPPAGPTGPESSANAASGFPVWQATGGLGLGLIIVAGLVFVTVRRRTAVV